MTTTNDEAKAAAAERKRTEARLTRLIRVGDKDKQVPMGGGRTPLTADLALLNFDSLPDSAVIPMKTLSALTSESPKTLLRKSRTDPRLQVVKHGFHSIRFKVRGVREYLGELPPAATSKKTGGAK